MDHACRALLFPACSQFISNFKLFIIFPRQNSACCCCTLLANPCSRNRRFHSAQVRQISTKTRITPSRHPAHFCSPPAVLRTRNPARTYYTTYIHHAAERGIWAAGLPCGRHPEETERLCEGTVAPGVYVSRSVTQTPRLSALMYVRFATLHCCCFTEVD